MSTHISIIRCDFFQRVYTRIFQFIQDLLKGVWRIANLLDKGGGGTPQGILWLKSPLEKSVYNSFLSEFYKYYTK